MDPTTESPIIGARVPNQPVPKGAEPGQFNMENRTTPAIADSRGNIEAPPLPEVESSATLGAHLNAPLDKPKIPVPKVGVEWHETPEGYVPTVTFPAFQIDADPRAKPSFAPGERAALIEHVAFLEIPQRVFGMSMLNPTADGGIAMNPDWIDLDGDPNAPSIPTPDQPLTEEEVKNLLQD